MEFSSKEPELMGMGKGVDLVMGNQLSDYIAASAKAKTAAQSQTKTVETVDSSKNPDAKFGENKPEDEEELQACSGIALKRIKEAESRLHGKFAKVCTMVRRHGTLAVSFNLFIITKCHYKDWQ